MRFIQIGTLSYEKSAKLVYVKLNSGFEKACVKLGEFSDCLVFTLNDERIYCNNYRINEVNEKLGKITLAMNNDEILKGELIDIKPYFPCEDVIRDSKEQNDRYLVDFKGQTIGEYKLINHRQLICLDESNDMEYLDKISKGDYIRVLWWFHRFDKESFRRNRMCQPPYDDAPKTGIFATRSPVRPNPIASTIVKVASVNKENRTIEMEGFDGFENSKVLQIMYYQPHMDLMSNTRTPEWVNHWTGYKVFKKSDETLIDVENEGDFMKDRDNYDSNSDFFKELETEDMLSKEDIDFNEINIKHASTHNLKNISLTIPKGQITLITGVSGSGKSSLAFDTIYAESQKQFMDLVLSNHIVDNGLNDTKVEKITGLQPAIAIEQRSLSSNPRSTVGTMSKIADFIKILFSIAGERICPNCLNKVSEDNVCKACGNILFSMTPQMFSYNNPDYMCPVCKGLGVEMKIDESIIVEKPNISLLDGASSWWGDLRKHRKNPNANWMRGEVLALADEMEVDLELPFNQLPEDYRYQIFHGSDGRKVSFKYKNSNGRSGTITRPVEGVVNTLHRLLKDSKSSKAMEYTFKYMTKQICSHCNGERIRNEGRLVNIKGYRFPKVMDMSIETLHQWCHYIYSKLNDEEKKKTKGILSKIVYRLSRIEDVGLSYITPNRSIPSLSGGEAQRLKIATQFGSGLSNILYIMDEPSKGLHPKDYKFLMNAIKDLKRLNNTIIIVEHKKSFLSIADKHIEMGPKAGRYGGEVIAVQHSCNIDPLEEETHNGYCISSEELQIDTEVIEIKGVTTNNLKSVDVKIPIGAMTAIIGVSGSGKSSLISKTLYPALMDKLGKRLEERGKYESITGIEKAEDVVYVSQKPIGANSRSNPGTYTGVFDLIRNYFAKSKEAKKAKLKKEHFSFNSKQGQCPACKGLGQIPVDMHYMENIYVTCNHCNGKRFIEEVLAVKPDGYSIFDILEMEISELIEVFRKEEDILEMLCMIEKVGLSYLKLGQNATTLSGGEAQRIKLAKELYRKSLKKVIYILDEPTTGLHDSDVNRLISVLNELNKKGATILTIEHNTKMIEACDWVIELGPGGGSHGGEITQMGKIILKS